MATQTKIATLEDLKEMFDRRHGARFITIVGRTTPKLLKGAPNVVKVSRVNCCVWFNYSSAVNAQREREGLTADFQAKPRKWGVRLANSALVEHKGNYYLECKVERSLDHKYIDPATGAEVSDDTIKPFLPTRNESATQGVNREIIIRDYNLDNIETLTHEGVTYVIAKRANVPMGT